MNNLECIEEMKKIQTNLLTFIESDDELETSFDDLKTFFEDIKFRENPNRLKSILQLIYKISKNHQRKSNFYDKIKSVFLFFEEDIKNTFSNYELFLIFKNSKLILLILFENKILLPDEDIISWIQKQSLKHLFVYEKKYSFYFYPEIKPFISQNERNTIETRLLKKDKNIFSIFDEKRRIGENDSYVCELIRNDSIEEFVSYVHQNNISVKNARIKDSLFETNTFFIKKNPTFFEYATFFNSIQIFQYIRFNDGYLDSSLWLYAVHSKSPEMFHFMEEFHVDKKNDSYIDSYKEAIKCHHHDIADYIQENLLTERDAAIYEKEGIETAFHFHNYSFLPEKLNNHSLDYFCLYDYYEPVNTFLLITNAVLISELAIVNFLIFLIKFKKSFVFFI